MTKKSRRILLLILVILFLLATPAIILYSQGYRFDFENKKLTQTGGLFLKITPRQTEIYLDGKLVKKTDFLFGSALIENLIPKKYRVEIKKENYQPWEKNLEIKEKEVTEVKTIVLFPEDLNFSISSKEVEDFWPLPDEKEIPLGPKNAVVSQKINGALYYLDNLGRLFRENSKINQVAFPVKQEGKYKLWIFPDYIFLADSKTLYLLNPDSGAFEKFFDGVEDLKISPNEKKLTFFSNSEIWVLFLKDKLDAPRKKAGQKLFLLRLSERIANVFWLNSDYLVFNAGSNIKIAEIDERDRVQTWQIGNFPEPKIFFNKIDKKLYILSEGNLYSSENLLK